MTHSPHRRTLLIAGAALPLMLALDALDALGASGAPSPNSVDARFADLERASGGRLGVCAIDTANGAQISYRSDERFPFCSTFKLMLAAAALAHGTLVAGFMQQRVRYARRDLVTYSPVSSRHVESGMTVEELCAAAIQYSDNTSANLLMNMLGGPAAVTAFARSIGDAEFRLDRRETELNTAIPGDARDTSTPAAMAQSVRALCVGDALPAPQRAQLQDWLRGNTTGAKRIRAGVPPGWQVGDKTGTGERGTANDVGVLWLAARKPVVLAVYHTQQVVHAQPNDAIIAAATRVVMRAFG